MCYQSVLNFFLDLCPKFAAYYGNRAATYMMMNKYLDALEDARQSVRLDDTFVKVQCLKFEWDFFLNQLH